MRKHTWLIPLVALSLATTLTWADLGFAQGQGQQRRGAAVQGQGQGAGPNCPNYSGSQTCSGTGGVCNVQTRARKRVRQKNSQTQANPNTQSQTPAPQSGN
jgi:hypothetical protein